MPLNRNLFKGTASLLSNLFAGQIITLLYSILGTRLFSPLEFGKIMGGVAVSMIVATVADFGFAQEALRSQVIGSSSPHFVISKKNILRIVLCGWLLAIGMWMTDFNLAYLAMPAIGFAWYLSVLAAIPYRADSNFIKLSLASSSGRITGLVLACSLLLVNQSEVFYVIGFSLIYLFDGIGLFALGRRFYKTDSNPFERFKIQSSLVAILPVIQNVDIIAIRAASPIDAGIFSAVNRWPAAIGSLVTAINVANFNNHISTGIAKRIWQADIIPYFVLVSFSSAIALFFSSSIIDYVLPTGYSECLFTFRILIFISLVSFWNQAYFSRFIAKGNHLKLSYIYAFWTCVQIALLYWLTKQFALETALIGVLGAQMLMLLNFINLDRSLK
jgi:O-antigen/teichoic acid export membrane protein